MAPPMLETGERRSSALTAPPPAPITGGCHSTVALQRPVVPDVRIYAVQRRYRRSLRSGRMRAVGQSGESAPGRAGRQGLYAVQRRCHRSSGARNVASTKRVGRGTPWSSSSSPASDQPVSGSVLRSVAEHGAGIVLPHTGLGRAAASRGGKVERVARVPQAASDLATVEKSWSRTAAPACHRPGCAPRGRIT